MRSRYLLPVMFLVVAALLAGCSSAKAPTWTYAPNGDGGEQVASATAAPAAGDPPPRQRPRPVARSRSLLSTSASSPPS